MPDDRVVALALVPTLLGGFVVTVASFVRVPDALLVAGVALFAAGAVTVTVSAVRAGRRRGHGALRALGGGARVLVGWLVAFLP